MADTPSFISRCLCGCGYEYEAQLQQCDDCNGWRWVAVAENQPVILTGNGTRNISPAMDTAEEALRWMLEAARSWDSAVTWRGIDGVPPSGRLQ